MHVIYPIGILADEQGETFIARVDNLPFDDLLRGITNKSDQYIGESFELAYRIDFKDFHKFSPESSFGDMKVIGPHEWIPRFEINTEFPLSRDDDRRPLVGSRSWRRRLLRGLRLSVAGR